MSFSTTLSKIFILPLAIGLSFSGHITSSIDRTSEEAIFTTGKTNQLTYQNGDSIVIILNGYFVADGSCDDDIIWGLESKTKNGEWKIAKDVTHGSIMMCGFGKRQCKREAVIIMVLDSSFPSLPREKALFTPGEHRLTFIKVKSQQLVRSNAFSIN